MDAASRRTTLRRRILCAGLLLAAGLVAAAGSNRVPADASAPLEVGGTPAGQQLHGPSFRVAAFNIHGGKGLDGRRDLGRIAACLAGYDIIGMNESYGGLPGVGEDQAATVARHLKMGWLFAPTSERWWHDHIGNSLLFAAEPTGRHRIPLPSRQDKKFRNAVLATFEHNGQPIRVLLTHLDTRVDREEQLRIVLDLFESLEAPAILMGDLNTGRTDPQLRALLATGTVLDAVGEHAAHDSPNRIDWILTRGLKCLAAGVTPTDASDHPVVWAELSCESEARGSSERELPFQSVRGESFPARVGERAGAADAELR